MTAVTILNHKSIWLILDAINHRIALQEARYKTLDPGEDADGDFGNDLAYLKRLREEFAALQAKDGGAPALYQCWKDPTDSSLSLLRFDRVAEYQARGTLSDKAVMLYEFPAHTGEEAMAIHALRQGWAPYLPMGSADKCRNCGAIYYPEGYGDCWRCGHIG